ncbi:unnamed protein product [Camellia sinensis]
MAVVIEGEHGYPKALLRFFKALRQCPKIERGSQPNDALKIERGSKSIAVRGERCTHIFGGETSSMVLWALTGESLAVTIGAITKRMIAIEEMAGMDVLCSDKTRTLTLNRLTVDRNLIEIWTKTWRIRMPLIQSLLTCLLIQRRHVQTSQKCISFLSIQCIDSDNNWYRASKGSPEQTSWSYDGKEVDVEGSWDDWKTKIREGFHHYEKCFHRVFSNTSLSLMGNGGMPLTCHGPRMKPAMLTTYWICR